MKIKTRKFEIKLYEKLGVKNFKKHILKFEKIKHRKDASKNINYHIGGYDVISMRKFTGFLLYNSACHVIGLVFVVLYFFITLIKNMHYPVADIIIIVLCIFNIYCIMLQRYTYLKLQTQIQKRIEANNRRIENEKQLLVQKLKSRDYSELQEEYSLIQRIANIIENGGDCFITEADVPILYRIATGFCFREKKNNKNDICNYDTFLHTISNIPQIPLVIESTELKTLKLQNILRIPKKNNILFGFSVITENNECEKLFKKIFSGNSYDCVAFVLEILIGAYKERLLWGEGCESSNETS